MAVVLQGDGAAEITVVVHLVCVRIAVEVMTHHGVALPGRVNARCSSRVHRRHATSVRVMRSEVSSTLPSTVDLSVSACLATGPWSFF